MNDSTFDPNSIEIDLVKLDLRVLRGANDTGDRQNVAIAGKAMLDSADAILDVLRDGLWDVDSDLSQNPRIVAHALAGVRSLVQLGSALGHAAFHAADAIARKQERRS
jgi:hypothetical protein